MYALEPRILAQLKLCKLDSAVCRLLPAWEGRLPYEDGTVDSLGPTGKGDQQ